MATSYGRTVAFMDGGDPGGYPVIGLHCGARLDVDPVPPSEAGLVGIWLNRAGTNPRNLSAAIATSSELTGLLTT